MTIILDTQQLRDLVNEARSVMKIAVMETYEESERLNRANEAKVNAQLLTAYRRKVPVGRCITPDQSH
jgi:hypothetical protein